MNILLAITGLSRFLVLPEIVSDKSRRRQIINLITMLLSLVRVPNIVVLS